MTDITSKIGFAQNQEPLGGGGKMGKALNKLLKHFRSLLESPECIPLQGFKLVLKSKYSNKLLAWTLFLESL